MCASIDNREALYVPYLLGVDDKVPLIEVERLADVLYHVQAHLALQQMQLACTEPAHRAVDTDELARAKLAAEDALRLVQGELAQLKKVRVGLGARSERIVREASQQRDEAERVARDRRHELDQQQAQLASALAQIQSLEQGIMLDAEDAQTSLLEAASQADAAAASNAQLRDEYNTLSTSLALAKQDAIELEGQLAISANQALQQLDEANRASQHQAQANDILRQAMRRKVVAQEKLQRLYQQAKRQAADSGLTLQGELARGIQQVTEREKLRQQYQEATAQLDGVAQERDVARQRCEAAEKQLREVLEERDAAHIRVVEGMQQTMAEQAQAHLELVKERDGLEARLSTHAERFHAVEGDSRSLAALQSEHAALVDAHKTYTDFARQFTQWLENDNLQEVTREIRAMSQLAADNSKRIQAVEKEKAELVQKVTDLSASVSALAIERDGYRAQVEQVQKSTSVGIAQIPGLLAGNRSRFNDAVEAKQQLEAEKKEWTETKATLKATVEELRARADTAEADLLTVKERLEANQKALDAERSSREALEAKVQGEREREDERIRKQVAQAVEAGRAQWIQIRDTALRDKAKEHQAELDERDGQLRQATEEADKAAKGYRLELDKFKAAQDEAIRQAVALKQQEMERDQALQRQSAQPPLPSPSPSSSNLPTCQSPSCSPAPERFDPQTVSPLLPTATAADTDRLCDVARKRLNLREKTRIPGVDPLSPTAIRLALASDDRLQSVVTSDKPINDYLDAHLVKYSMAAHELAVALRDSRDIELKFKAFNNARIRFAKALEKKPEDIRRSVGSAYRV